MRIICNECGNEKYFTKRKEVEVDFDYEKGEWDEEHPTIGEETIVCKECGADQISNDIVIVKNKEV